jgi:hypothetical protein
VPVRLYAGIADTDVTFGNSESWILTWFNDLR